MNEPSNQKPLDFVNERSPNGQARWAQNAIGTAVAALVVASIIGSFTLRDTVSNVVTDIAHIENVMTVLSDDLLSLQDDCKDVEIGMAKLPPLHWQNRIISMEKTVATCGCFGPPTKQRR